MDHDQPSSLQSFGASVAVPGHSGEQPPAWASRGRARAGPVDVLDNVPMDIDASMALNLPASDPASPPVHAPACTAGRPAGAVQRCALALDRMAQALGPHRGLHRGLHIGPNMTLHMNPHMDPRPGARQGHSQRLARALAEARQALTDVGEELRHSRASERAARHRALQDDLTALPNQVGFRGRLDRSMARAGPAGIALAVLYLDVDHFKAVNDRHGHAVGDALLRAVAARLRGAVRAEDSVGRLGGDEFACVVTHLPDTAALAQLVAQLLHHVCGTVTVGALQLPLKVSVGIAIWPRDGHTADELLRHADQAMYQAKRQRSGHAFFSRSLGS